MGGGCDGGVGCKGAKGVRGCGVEGGERVRGCVGGRAPALVAVEVAERMKEACVLHWCPSLALLIKMQPCSDEQGPPTAMPGRV